MSAVERLAIIGLDCAEPSLVFGRWRSDLPNLARLAADGLSGALESCLPPITVPAWACMASGVDPGALGVYGFRDRLDYSYDRFRIASSADIAAPRLWDLASAAGLPSIVVGVPPTYPIARPPLGVLVSCFLTPSTASAFTHPAELAAELHAEFGEYLLDAEGFGREAPDVLLQRMRAMTRQRFAVCRRLLKSHPWRLFWMVDMGIDRVQHGFWRFMDPQHHRYTPGHALAEAVHDFYVLVDTELGRLLDDLNDAGAALLVVSDHGAKRLDGGFCINDWLIGRGWLRMTSAPRGVERFDPARVDWPATQAWAEGGYTARIMLNVVGREPQGCVPPAEVGRLLSELTAALEAVEGPGGRQLGIRAYRPAELYAEVRGVAPDLIVTVGDLHWRGVGSVGHRSLLVQESASGPDDANHAQRGLYILANAGGPTGRRDASIYDVLPTCLELLGLAPPMHALRGVSLLRR